MGRRKRTGGPAFSLFAFQDIITCVMGIMLLLTLMMSLQIADAPGAQMASKVNTRAQELEKETSRLLVEIDQMESQLASQLSALNSGAILDPTLLSQSRDRAVREAAAAEKEMHRVAELVEFSQKQLQDVRLRFGEVDQITADSASLEQLISKRRQELEDLKSGRKRVYNAHESDARSCWIVEVSSPLDIRVAQMGKEGDAMSFAGIDALVAWTNTLNGDDIALMLLVKPSAANSLGQLSKSLVERKLAFGFDLLPQDAAVLEATEEPQP